MRRFLAVLGSVCLAVIMAVGYVLIDKWTAPDGGGSGGAPSPTLPAGELTGLLAQVVVAPELPMTGYSREEFPHWDLNTPEHGFGADFAQYARCTTRDVMMLRDAVGPVQLDPKSCELTVGSGGGWQDEYGFIDRKTGALKPYKFMTESSAVDAEHIVALAEAWRSGAAKLDENTRRNIANDAVNLVAADPSANRSKGDQDAANYLPPGKFRCAYVGRYLQVKVKYGLSVDSAEQAALRTAVDDCVREGGSG
ncbi:HNH endonuclease family protein [Rhodococcus sp. SGAir0479]|uniref:HNH endonuclease family protein n=1 Tax=Rhodococcus sp. SGAir0479 TaxID=2567884 RepID=UPI0020C79E72|nr:HNH endonuclease family protein [Rhodococcus sp. SGAir0479]